MTKALEDAFAYMTDWLGFQMRMTRQPGCALAVARGGQVIFERAFGQANATTGEALTPRHRFRVASHSKSFTATAVMMLREAGRLGLDEQAGRFVHGLHPAVAAATLTQLLSHGAGIIRDGTDAGQWIDERPFADEGELRRALTAPPLIAPDSRMKYSNHAYGLVGLVIEAVTGERYGNWVTRNILLTLGLDETLPDAPFPDGAPVARGHSAELPLGRRVIIPGDNPTNALAPATGFISTAADLARFFATLDPDAESSLLRPESRRTMLKRQWASPNSADEAHYGLGLCLGAVRDWPWAGHGGGFQSAKTFTAMLPGRSLCLSVLTNANDGLGEKWSSGLIHILKTFADSPAADARSRSWRGRWWRFGTAIDLVPFADRVLILSPDQMDPFGTPDEITVTGRDTGVVSRSDGYGMQGESARLVRGRNGRVQEVWLGGDRWIPEQRMAVEMLRKYDRRPAAKSGSGTALAR